ncbi:MAG: ester cyclase [Candidatus Methanomethylicaceae archaeon]|jgi:predicted SnoaL-like aldol condensation-catalyzing enzyme
MSLEELKVLVRNGVEELNKQNLAVLDEFMAVDYVDHTNQLRNREEVKQLYAKIFKNMPDFHRIVEDMIAEGDKVWVLFRITGTDHSGKKMESTSVTIFRMANGKVVEGWTVPQVVSIFPQG